MLRLLPPRFRPQSPVAPRSGQPFAAFLQAMALAGGVVASGCRWVAVPAVAVNQHGYIPHSAKVAVVKSRAPEPQSFTVVDDSGQPVFAGTTQVRSGVDPESGDAVHWADFSALTARGKNLRVEVDGHQSYPFSIDRDIYSSLRRASLNYFYHNRSGVPIEIPWAGAWKWTRPAGHLSDASVGCIADCDYKLNALGGWYDAGDHGKYVVNGGISVWTLFHLYERTERWGRGPSPMRALGDGSLAIPENDNQIPDLLDEVRWEMEWLLRMQVPPGQPLAGMVHHKLHDTSWSPLGMTPPEHFQGRFLHPPSTAATLNVAATGAQCFRIFRSIEPQLAERCRLGAIRAWNAAQKFPDHYAPQYSSQGGGPYDDRDVSDEQYWAATEMYLTFGTPSLRRAMQASPHYRQLPSLTGHEASQQSTSMTWQATAALGTLSLLTVATDLPAEDRSVLLTQLRATADQYLDWTERQGYRVPLQASSEGKYPWGSNSLVANNALVLALAFDLTGARQYFDGVVDGMDYLLGRNPLNFSYVSGFGERSLSNPHHRFWAHQAIARFPGPPPGALAGGPNSSKQDPTAGRLGDCPPQRCYIDDVQAWSVNEVAINWNAPLAWLAAFLDESGHTEPKENP